MADVGRTLSAFDALLLRTLPNDWVQTVWEQDFVDLSSLPVAAEGTLVENDYFIDQLDTVREVVSAWLQLDNQNDNGEGLWSVLVENEIPHKNLVALLAYMTFRAGQVSVSCSERIAGILSASVYLKLIALPGSSAFQMYNPELFLQACRLLNKWNKTDLGGGGKRKKNKSPVKQSQKSQRGKGRKRAKRNSDQSSIELFDSQDLDEDHDDSVELTTEEVRRLDLVYAQLLQDVLLICEKFSLRQSESTATQLLAVLVTLTRMEPESAPVEMGNWDSPRCGTTTLAYKAMSLLCQPFHGHVSALSTDVTKLLLGHVLMIEDGKLFPNLVVSVLRMRQQALNFVKHLLLEIGERYLTTVKTLIQRIAFRVPDKSEYRSYAAQSVCDLLECLPDADYASMLQLLKRLSKHKKVCQRSFILDVMSLLLDLPERRMSADVPAEMAEFASHKSMICIMLSRCSDINASIRSRALAGFSACTTSKHTDIVRTVKEVITPIAASNRPTAKQFVPTPFLSIKGGTEDSNNADGAVGDEGGERPQQAPDGTSSEQLANETEAQSAQTSDRNDDVAAVAPPGGADDGTPQACVLRSFCNMELTPGFNPYLPDPEGVVSMFRRRAQDSKVVVRKFALQALQRVIQFEVPDYRSEDLDVLRSRCRDPALSVRKQAVQCLAELLEAFPTDANFQKAWVFGLMPQVMDKETSVQEKCFDVLEETILQKIQTRNRSSDAAVEWALLNIISKEGGEALRRHLQKACQHWARLKKFKQSMVSALESHVGGPNDQAAWMLLAEMSKVNVKMDHDFIVEHWKTVDSLTEADASCDKWTDVLCVLSSCAKSMPSKAITGLLDDLKNRLHQFSYPFALIARMVITVSQLHNCLDSEASQRQKQAWGAQLMSECDSYMSSVILNADSTQDQFVDEEQLIRYMFTLGEVCQMCPTRMPRRAALLIQSVIAAPCISDLGNSGDRVTLTQASDGSDNNNHTNESDSQENSSGSRAGQSGDKGTAENVSNSQQQHSQEELSSQRSSQFSQPLSQFRGSKMSNKLRSHAFITLGKLCLVDESLAKKTIAALARELEEAEFPAIRNNVVIVMSTLTIRYTTLVDRYMTNIAACLKDPSPLVRKNTLIVLTRLLQEEYVKWKGVLFFRYIATLLDDSEEVRNLAEYSLAHLLLPKHPGMFFHPFIECIFHFNSYHSHQVYNKFKQTDREKQKFTLAGKLNTGRRLKLYSFMLEHMTDEQRFKITDKINKEILSTTVDNILPFDEDGAMLLKDALAILSCKEIKLSTLRGKGVEEAGEEGMDMAQMVTATAKKVLITQVVRRNVIENIVPVVISLKHMLEKKRSPLLKDLMRYLRELMKDYKNEVKDILAADKQLAEEIEFDLRNFETQQAERAAGGKQGSRPGTPVIRSGSNTPVVRSGASTPVMGSRPSSRPASPLVKANQPTTTTVMGDAGQPAAAVRPTLRESTADQNVQMVASPRPPLSDAGSSGGSSPVAAAGSPSRRASVSLVNAARKAMSRVDQLRSSPSSPFRKGAGHSKGKRTAQNQSDDHSKGNTTEETDENSLSPMRAISTPTGDALYNITFAGEGNLTICPPSPIPSVASAINKGGQLCLSPAIRVQRRGNKEVIHMPHPDAKDPELAQWNIKSPVVKEEAPSPTSSANNAGDSTPTRKSFRASRAGLRRSSRQRKV
ncbi:condensin-2 complex subunit D3 [Aplysia californica]|uniref:Condensin-2 complex subunit D3 n=1 Tax=Aplysia californica TaxID=6500 RepID=A0ABM1ABY8_APLCA|nr:condensin-2 complex subunit D3 [Aplysia californica]